jgi:ribosomal protein L35
MKSKSGLKKRIKITKSGKIKRLQAARSHLRRHKSKRAKQPLDVSKANRKIRKLVSK